MTEEIPKLIELQRDEAARRFVQALGKRTRSPGFQSPLRGLALLLRRHGLGRTLTYLQVRGAGRSDSAFQMVYEQLAGWLRQQIGLPTADALATITGNDSRLYLRASEEAVAFALALRRALASELAEDHVGGAGAKSGDKPYSQGEVE